METEGHTSYKKRINISNKPTTTIIPLQQQLHITFLSPLSTNLKQLDLQISSSRSTDTAFVFSRRPHTSFMRPFPSFLLLLCAVTIWTDLFYIISMWLCFPGNTTESPWWGIVMETATFSSSRTFPCLTWLECAATCSMKEENTSFRVRFSHTTREKQDFSTLHNENTSCVLNPPCNREISAVCVLEVWWRHIFVCFKCVLLTSTPASDITVTIKWHCSH